ncbi:hypothetical protein Bbelb_309830 [Branchiostoma belcheri]|nr:hypothetical protein Bbelb_309830 [Branchiostoma belcheri]
MASGVFSRFGIVLVLVAWIQQGMTLHSAGLSGGRGKSLGHNPPYVLFVRSGVDARHSHVTHTVLQECGLHATSGRERLRASFVAQVDSVRRRYSPRTDDLRLPTFLHVDSTQKHNEDHHVMNSSCNATHKATNGELPGSAGDMNDGEGRGVSRPNADVVPPEETQIAMRDNQFETTSRSGLGSRRFQCDLERSDGATGNRPRGKPPVKRLH